MLDNSTCLLTTLEMNESSNFTFCTDKRNSQDWGRSFPWQFCSKWQLFVHLQIKLNAHYTSCKCSCHTVARWKSAPRKCRCNSCVFHSFYYCALGVTELLTWEEKWKEGGGRKGLDVYFIGGWLSPFADRWLYLGHWGVYSQAIPILWASTNKKKNRGQGSGNNMGAANYQNNLLLLSDETQ